MKQLIRSVRMLNPDGVLAKKATDILIEDGTIRAIGTSLTAPRGAQVFEYQGAIASPGWLDSKANFREPGEEVKEGIASGLRAAAAGGYSGVVLMPSTNPCIETKSDVAFLRNRAAAQITDLYPAGALSAGREGKDITEMYDMQLAGAVAFTDDKRVVSDAGLMMRALQYSRSIGSLVVSYAVDPGIHGKGQVNEGISSTMAGMKGAPGFAEAIMIHRDLQICEYTGGRIHFATVSTAEGVALIRKAKKQKLPVTAEVSAHHLFYDDSQIMGYDTNYKVLPPLRSRKDRDALRKAVADGTIDCICSDHAPQDQESKTVEFDFASYGIAGIETAYAAANTALKSLMSPEQIAACFAINSWKIFGMPVPEIREDAPANITVFDPEAKWKPDGSQFKSRGRNNPFIGVELTGRPLAVFNHGTMAACF